MKVLPVLIGAACAWLGFIDASRSQPALPPLPPGFRTNAVGIPQLPPRPQIPTNLIRLRMAQQASNALAARMSAATNVATVEPMVRPLGVSPRLTSVPQAFRPNANVQPPSYLAWDADNKSTNVSAGITNVHFSFWLTNVASEEVLVHSVQTSCGCTVAQLPAYPWRLTPGSNGPIHVTVDLRGKFGSFSKGVTVDTSAGLKQLTVAINQPDAGTTPGMDMERLKNMRLAMADRQVVFKGECAKCHSEPATGKSGQQLYTAVCGNCHDSIHRAALVPDLKSLTHPTSAEHWQKWIAEGKVGSMMPAFAQSAGGPLNDQQIQSLVQFLTETITNKPRNAGALTNATPRAALDPSAKAQ